MKDRIPTPGQEGRVLITPENGDAPFYAKVAMADNPSENGTPLHKATLLKDATAAMFGLPNTAVPDDALQAIWALIDSTNDLAQSRAQITTGSYIGTDTYGAGNPNSLTFARAPKAIVIVPSDIPIKNGDYYNTGYDCHIGIFVYGAEYPAAQFDGSNVRSAMATPPYGLALAISGWGTNTISWYSSEDEYCQLNSSKYKYNYFVWF